MDQKIVDCNRREAEASEWKAIRGCELYAGEYD